MNLTRVITADAQRDLAVALHAKVVDRAAQALRQLVESVLPHPSMPSQRFRRSFPQLSGMPHGVWRWVGRDGTITLVARVLDNWQTVEVKVTESYPGLGRRDVTIYRDEIDDPKNVTTLVEMAVRQLKSTVDPGYL